MDNREDDPDSREKEIMKKFGWEEEYYQGRITFWMKYKPKIWALFDEPYSSQTAKVRNSNNFVDLLNKRWDSIFRRRKKKH